jgi:acetolactate synthase-1/2/3 large subunit
MVKVSDYIWDFLIDKGIDTVFMVSGGAAAHLMDSLNKRRDKIKVVCCYHEQACAMAADGYFRIAGKPACVLVTNGPGSTNTITGVLGAYQDSIPMFVISGQVPTNQLNPGQENELIKLRQLGVQECNIVSIVKNITKFALILKPSTKNSNKIAYDLSKAWNEMMKDRMGPVWIDTPLDVQNSQINLTELLSQPKPHRPILQNKINRVVNELKQAKRPLIIAGNGIHLSKTEKILKELFLPTVTTWNAKDIFNYNDPFFIGSFGLLGERAGNFAVQNADFILVLGSRLSVPNMGYNAKAFAPKAKKFIVDIDSWEIVKPTTAEYSGFIHIEMNLKDFMPLLAVGLSLYNPPEEWVDKVRGWKYRYPVYQPQYANETKGINSFHFINELSKYLNDNHVIVTDMGTAFTCTMQGMKMNGKARMFTSSATCAMGFGLPGAIGAWFADPTKEIILIAGDGGFQMNIQELQTVKHHNIPLKIFILNNNGYSAISLMQDNLFKGEYIGSTNKDISSPNFIKIGKAYNLKVMKISNPHETLQDKINEFHGGEKLDKNKRISFWVKEVLDDNQTILCEVVIPENQPLYPRVQSSKNEDGSIISNSLENMYPYLSNEEMKEIMS